MSIKYEFLEGAKPCPFCGHEEVDGLWDNIYYIFRVACANKDCRAEVGAPHITKSGAREDALEKWNRRVK